MGHKIQDIYRNEAVKVVMIWTLQHCAAVLTRCQTKCITLLSVTWGLID